MTKSLIAQIAEIQNQYSWILTLDCYQDENGVTMFMFDMGDYSSVDKDPEIALQNLIDIVIEKENLKI